MSVSINICDMGELGDGGRLWRWSVSFNGGLATTGMAESWGAAMRLAQEYAEANQEMLKARAVDIEREQESAAIDRFQSGAYRGYGFLQP